LSELPNLMDSIVNLQAALDAGTVKMRTCEIHQELQVLVDYPEGDLRLTYTRITEGFVLSVVVFIMAAPIDGVACFTVGYAVLESMRGRGVATQTVQWAMDELLNGLKRNGITKLYVEALESISDVPANRLAKRLFSESPTKSTEKLSGKPVYRYLKLLQ